MLIHIECTDQEFSECHFLKKLICIVCSSDTGFISENYFNQPYCSYGKRNLFWQISVPLFPSSEEKYAFQYFVLLYIDN